MMLNPFFSIRKERQLCSEANRITYGTNFIFFRKKFRLLPEENATASAHLENSQTEDIIPKAALSLSSQTIFPSLSTSISWG